MQRTVTDVDTYLAEVPSDRRDVLIAIRQLCLDHLPSDEEAMDYGMSKLSESSRAPRSRCPGVVGHAR